MSITLHISEVEGYDDAKEHVFTVRCVDEACAGVDLKQIAHTAASWREVSAEIEKALTMLKLEGDA